MNENAPRPIPLLGELSLEYIQRIEHNLDAGFVETRIPGFSGEVLQSSGRSLHNIQISGLLIGEKAAEELEKLQKAAEAGDELTFSASISSALDLKKVVIAHFRVVEDAGLPHRFLYELRLVESPPLPPPAKATGFGGLDDFGVGDLGFDTSIVGDLEDLAGKAAGAVDSALDALDQLNALANLDGLKLGGLLQPMENINADVSSMAATFKNATQTLFEAFTE